MLITPEKVVSLADRVDSWQKIPTPGPSNSSGYRGIIRDDELGPLSLYLHLVGQIALGGQQLRTFSARLEDTKHVRLFSVLGTNDPLSQLYDCAAADCRTRETQEVSEGSLDTYRRGALEHLFG